MTKSLRRIGALARSWGRTALAAGALLALTLTQPVAERDPARQRRRRPRRGAQLRPPHRSQAARLKAAAADAPLAAADGVSPLAGVRELPSPATTTSGPCAACPAALAYLTAGPAGGRPDDRRRGLHQRSRRAGDAGPERRRPARLRGHRRRPHEGDRRHPHLPAPDPPRDPRLQRPAPRQRQPRRPDHQRQQLLRPRPGPVGDGARALGRPRRGRAQRRPAPGTAARRRAAHAQGGGGDPAGHRSWRRPASRARPSRAV